MSGGGGDFDEESKKRLVLELCPRRRQVEALFLASYDVNKDGVKVAVLTFTKAAYRLGETVMGVVELNDRTSTARVLQVRSEFTS